MNGLQVDEVLADKGFKALEGCNIMGYIPNRGRFVFPREGLVYSPEKNSFSCPNGKDLNYRGTH